MSDHRSSQVRRERRDHNADDLDNVVPFTPAAEKAPTADTAAAAAKKSFTSQKLTWMNYLRKERRLDLATRMVGITIAQHINEKSKTTFVSDQLIADETGISVRSVIRARQALRDAGWIMWIKPNPRSPNHTKLMLIEGNIDAIDDTQLALKDKRDFEVSERRRKRGSSPFRPDTGVIAKVRS